MRSLLLQESEIALRLLTALLVGTILGFERSKAKKPAGIRTHSLVCIASTMISMVSAYGFGEFISSSSISMDPARLIVGVITGIGFLGAGIIWKDSATEMCAANNSRKYKGLSRLGIAIGLVLFSDFCHSGNAACIRRHRMIKIGLLKHDSEDRRVFDVSRD